MTSPENIQKYDSALLGILQHEGELEPFLDVVFGFLFRKTDFYHVVSDTQKRYGFPEGVAEKLIRKYFKKYKTLTDKMVKSAAENAQRRKAEQEQETSSSAVITEIEEPNDDQKQKSDVASAAPEPGPSEPHVNAVESKPEPIASQEQFQSNPDSYNGAVRDKYSWSQSYDDIDVIVPVTKTVTKGRQVKVNIERKHLFVSITDTDGTTDIALDGELKHEIMKEESMWSLEPSKSIQITLSKDTRYWWNALLVNEEEIDIQKIAPERSMADMQEDELAVINKLQFDEKQKRLGLPQSHEIKVHEMLKKGWDAEGSPFKGQKFDPKMFNVSPSGVQ